MKTPTIRGINPREIDVAGLLGPEAAHSPIIEMALNSYNTYWGLVDEGNLGIIYLTPITDVRIHVGIIPTVELKKDTADAFAEALSDHIHSTELKEGETVRLESTVPVPYKMLSRVFAKAGFSREGTLQRSVRYGDGLVNQTLWGLVLCHS